MTKDQQETINQLRHDGYAVVVWTPEELNFCSTSRNLMESRLVELGWDIISDLSEGKT